METPLISVIMPAFNASPTIREAIDSVLAQSWTNWELLVVDNGSTDGTSEVLMTMCDPRIIALYQPIRGVGHARNMGLRQMRGSFYCFLDADDELPVNSLADRAALLLSKPSIHFADGAIQAFNSNTRKVWNRTPTYRGPAPLDQLYTITGTCFLGPTWMIRRTKSPVQLFRTDMTHAEDLFYFMSIAHEGGYDHVDHPVLHYRVGNVSAMSDLSGLHSGYRQLIRAMRELKPAPSSVVIEQAWRRIRSIMFRSFLKRGRLVAAIKARIESLPV